MKESGAPHRYDALVIGSGLAGLAFAIEFSQHGSVCVLTKAEAKDANTSYAQGGIAAAVGEADDWKLHEADTLEAGAGLCDPDAVRFLVQGAPGAIEWLRSLGAEFTVGHGGDLELGLEGGHSRRRIVHFEDRTGWEIERAMVQAVSDRPNITVIEHAFATELVLDNGRCVGAQAEVESIGAQVFLPPVTMLARGGCGQMYLYTTNPRVATADGIALAHHAGAELRDLEFMQFHPTTLYHAQLRSFLITEAARGAGGTLRNHLGRRFMYDYDERLELAPRDVVARSIDAEMKRLDTWCVYLDLAHLERQSILDEFPTIYQRLLDVGIEMDKQWIPVVPAQHYSCGGVVTDLQARTSIPGLYAAGEVARTGVHGANRLASNSLLEAILFARSGAQAATAEPGLQSPQFERSVAKNVSETRAANFRKRLQRLMTEKVGIVRTSKELAQAVSDIQTLNADFQKLPDAPHCTYSAETRNLLSAAFQVAQAASQRTENAGLHYNLDLIVPSK